MKYSLLLLIIVAASCSQDPVSNSTLDQLEGYRWKTVAYSKNGIADNTVVSQMATFEFRTDGKLYFSQIGPSYKDTFNFSLADAHNIRLTKPGISAWINFKILTLTTSNFDFEATSSDDTDVDLYKTQNY